MVLTRRSFLGATLATLALPSCANEASTRRLVIVAARGGWDATFAFDPKPGVPGWEGPELYASGVGEDVEAVETIAGIPLLVNRATRPSVLRFFERWGDRAVVVNGISVGSIAHAECVHRVWTGGGDADAPDAGAIVGASGAAPVGYLDLGASAMSGRLADHTTRLGWDGQAELLADSTLDAADHTAITRWRATRAARLGLPESDTTAVEAAPIVGEALAELQLDPDDPVDAVGRALSAGLCSAVHLDPHLDWDTHDDNAIQNGCWEAMGALLDALAQELDTRGLLDDTLVVVLSEMGRPPWRNTIGGKDHWPVASALLFGGGLVGGRVLGGTDDEGLSLPVNLATGVLDPAGDEITPERLLAGILAAVGVDPEVWFPGVVGLGL